MLIIFIGNTIGCFDIEGASCPGGSNNNYFCKWYCRVF